MGKYSNANVLQRAIDEQNEQERLKHKHNIDDAEVVVVEKRNILKYIIVFIKAVFAVLLFCCAAIGIFTLLYSDSRQIFITVITEIFNSIFGG